MALSVILPCADCGMETARWEYYMLRFELWDRIVPEDIPGAGITYLCVGCVELRLGRDLMAYDFLACPLNVEVALGNRDSSPRLRSRLGPAGLYVTPLPTQ